MMADTNDTQNATPNRLAGLMAGKKGVILGVANERSIAWGIAKTLSEAGAEIAFTYQNEALEKRVRPLAEKLGSHMILPCDVNNEAHLTSLMAALKKQWGGIDFLVHAIAFSDKNELDGAYLNTSRDNFLKTMDVSCYSLTSLCRQAQPLLNDGASILSLSYYGAEKVMPHYNVMGVAKAALEASIRYLSVDLGKKNIRCNAISAGPIKTLAASGIGDFRFILKWNEHNTPLGRNVSQEEVGRSALYLLSELGSGVTGEVLHVDAGYHVMGMLDVDHVEPSANLLQEMVR